MDNLKTIEEHIVIRETIGYERLNDFDVMDIPEVLKFLKIMHNYIKMKQILQEDEIRIKRGPGK
jgi:hypothetical protein